MPVQSQYISLKSDMTKLCSKSHQALPNMIQCYKCSCTFSLFCRINHKVNEDLAFAQVTRNYSEPLFSSCFVDSSFSYLATYFKFHFEVWNANLFEILCDDLHIISLALLS